MRRDGAAGATRIAPAPVLVRSNVDCPSSEHASCDVDRAGSCLAPRRPRSARGSSVADLLIVAANLSLLSEKEKEKKEEEQENEGEERRDGMASRDTRGACALCCFA